MDDFASAIKTEEMPELKPNISKVPVAEIKNEPELSIHDPCVGSDSMDFKEESYHQYAYEIKTEIEDNESSGREFLTESESEYQTDAEEEENHQSKLHSQNEYDLRNLLHVCPICGDEFEYEKHAAWTSHLADKHELDKIEKLNFVTIFGSDPKTHGQYFKCTICRKVLTKNIRFLKNHAYSHMPFPITKCKICGTGSSGYKCTPCNCQGNNNDPYMNCNNCTLLCSKCVAPFEDGKQLKIHMGTEHNIRLPEDLHFKSVGPNSTIYECTKCRPEQAFRGTNFDAMLRHAVKHDKHKMFQCNHCKKAFTDIYNFKRHEAMCQTVEISHIKRLCPACGWRWTSQDSFEEHIKNVHSLNSMESLNVVKAKDPTQNKCVVCDHVFQVENMTAYKNHAFQHMPYKMYNCTTCDKGFDTQLEIAKHFNAKPNVDIDKSTVKCRANLNLMFICPVCNVELESKDAQKQHINKEHQVNTTLEGLSMKEVIIYDQNGAEVKKVYECLECGVQFGNKTKPFCRLQHRMLHFPYKPYKCKLCEKSLSHLYTFEKHLVKCNNLPPKPSPAPEDIDENTTKYQANLNMIFICPVCNVELESKNAQMRHINKEHQINTTLKGLAMKEVIIYDQKEAEANKIYECLECGAQLRNKSNPFDRLHHRMSHLPYKPYKCKRCRISLSYLQTMRMHLVKCKK